MVIFLFRQFFAQVPREPMDAAKIDGASWLTIFFRIDPTLVRFEYADVRLASDVRALTAEKKIVRRIVSQEIKSKRRDEPQIPPMNQMTEIGAGRNGPLGR